MKKVEYDQPKKKVHLNQSEEQKSLSELVATYKCQKENYKEFKRLKYKQNVYEINDVVFIRNESDPENDYIGVIQNIMLLNTPQELKPVIEVIWYYRKSDLPSKKYQKQLDCIGEHELFFTEHKDFALVDCINGIVQVLSYNDYDKLDFIGPNVFYSRAKYDVNKGKIYDPPIEEWETQCICQKPLNPDQLYIQCDECNQWYHQDCLKMTKEQADQLDNFICENCEQKTASK